MQEDRQFSPSEVNSFLEDRVWAEVKDQIEERLDRWRRDLENLLNPREADLILKAAILELEFVAGIPKRLLSEAKQLAGEDEEDEME